MTGINNRQVEGNQTIVSNFFIFDEKEHVFIDQRVRKIVKPTDVERTLNSMYKHPDYSSLTKIFKKCLERMKSPNPYGHLKDEEDNAMVISQEIARARISDDPLYLCNNCHSFASSLEKRPSHYKKCVKRKPHARKTRSSSPAEYGDMFTKYRGYQYKAEQRLRFLCIKYTAADGQEQNEPDEDFPDLSITNNSLRDSEIAGLVIFDSTNNLFVEKGTGKILNPFTSELKFYFRRNKSLWNKLDIIYELIDKYTAVINKPNYYIVENKAHNASVIMQKLKYCKENFKSPLFVCHSCEKVAWRKGEVRKARDHIKVCNYQNIKSALTVYRGYYNLMVEVGNVMKPHFLIRAKNFCKFISFEQFQSPGDIYLNGEDRTEEPVVSEGENASIGSSVVDVQGPAKTRISPRRRSSIDVGSSGVDNEDQQEIRKRKAKSETDTSHGNKRKNVSKDGFKDHTANSQIPEISPSKLAGYTSSDSELLIDKTGPSSKRFLDRSQESFESIRNLETEKSVLKGTMLWKSNDAKLSSSNISSSAGDPYSEDEGYLGDDGQETENEAETHPLAHGKKHIEAVQLTKLPNGKTKIETENLVYQDFESFETEFHLHTSPRTSIKNNSSGRESDSSDEFFTPKDDYYEHEEPPECIPIQDKNVALHDDFDQIPDFDFDEDKARVDMPSSPDLRPLRESPFISSPQRQFIDDANEKFKRTGIQLIPIKSDPVYDRAVSKTYPIPLIPTTSTILDESEVGESSELDERFETVSEKHVPFLMSSDF